MGRPMAEELVELCDVQNECVVHVGGKKRRQAQQIGHYAYKVGVTKFVGFQIQIK